MVEHYDIWKYKNCGSSLAYKLEKVSDDIPRSHKSRWALNDILKFAQLVSKHQGCLDLKQSVPEHVLDEMEVDERELSYERGKLIAKQEQLADLQALQQASRNIKQKTLLRTPK